MKRSYCVYILTNKYRTIFYVGFTGNIEKRLIYHYFKCVYNLGNGFTALYNCYYLIYLEGFDNAKSALKRERQLKNWTRKKKRKLIESQNPNYIFMNEQITNWPPDIELLELVRNDEL